jgi:hypothetical protein
MSKQRSSGHRYRCSSSGENGATAVPANGLLENLRIGRVSGGNFQASAKLTRYFFSKMSTGTGLPNR